MNTGFELALMDPWLRRASYPYPELLQRTSSFHAPFVSDKVATSRLHGQPFFTTDRTGVHNFELHGEFQNPKTVLKPTPLRLSDFRTVGMPSNLFQCNRNFSVRQHFQSLAGRIGVNDIRNPIKLSGFQPLGFPYGSPGYQSRVSPLQVSSSLNLANSFDSPECKSRQFEMIFKEMLAKRLEFLYAHRISNSTSGFHIGSNNGDETKQETDQQTILQETGLSLAGTSPHIKFDTEHAKGKRGLLDTTGKDLEKKWLETSKRSKDNSASSYVHKLKNLALKNTRKRFLTPASRVAASAFSKMKSFYSDCNASLVTQYPPKRLKLDSSTQGSQEHESTAKVSQTDRDKNEWNKKTEFMSTAKGFKELSTCENNQIRSSQNVNYKEARAKGKSLILLSESDPNLQQPLGDRKTFKCPQCRYLTDRKNNLKRHIVTMHQASSKTLECCGVAFQSKAALRDHNAVFHRGGYRCKICSRNFCRKALLRRHLTVHSGQKDFFCDLCGYATSHKSNLERHQKVHNKRDVADYPSKKSVAPRHKTEYIDPMAFLRGLANNNQNMELQRNPEISQNASVFGTDSNIRAEKDDCNLKLNQLLRAGYSCDKRPHPLLTQCLQETHTEKSHEVKDEDETFFKFSHHDDINSESRKGNISNEDDVIEPQLKKELGNVQERLEKNIDIFEKNNFNTAKNLNECLQHKEATACDKSVDENENVNQENKGNGTAGLSVASTPMFTSDFATDFYVVGSVQTNEEAEPINQLSEFVMDTHEHTNRTTLDNFQQKVQQWQLGPGKSIGQVNTDSYQSLPKMCNKSLSMNLENYHGDIPQMTVLKTNSPEQTGIPDKPEQIENQDSHRKDALTSNASLHDDHITSGQFRDVDHTLTAATTLTVSNPVTPDLDKPEEDVGHTNRKRMYAFTYSCSDCLLKFQTQSSLTSHDCKRATNQSGFGLPVVTAVNKGCEILVWEKYVA